MSASDPNAGPAPASLDQGFTGTWNTKTDKNWTYVMTLVQDGREVTGSYVAQDNSKGRIKGRFGANIIDALNGELNKDSSNCGKSPTPLINNVPSSREPGLRRPVMLTRDHRTTPGS